MKNVFVILILIICSIQIIYSQSTEDIIGEWEVESEGQMAYDTTYLLNSLGNVTKEIVAIDSLIISNDNFKKSIWIIRKREITIINESQFGNNSASQFKYELINQQIILTNNHEKKKYRIKDRTSNKLVLNHITKELKSEWLKLNKK